MCTTHTKAKAFTSKELKILNFCNSKTYFIYFKHLTLQYIIHKNSIFLPLHLKKNIYKHQKQTATSFKEYKYIFYYKI